MDINELECIKRNKYLNEKVNMILEKVNNIEKYNSNDIYYACQTLLNYINFSLIAKAFKIKLEGFDIIKVIEIYQQYDNELYEEMLGINGEYNSDDDITKSDIEYLLRKMDLIYAIIVEKFGGF